MFKKDLDLYNAENAPYVYNLFGRLPGSSGIRDNRARHVRLRGHCLLGLDRQHADRGLRRRRYHARLLASGRLCARPARPVAGARPRRRHLPRLPDPADAALLPLSPVITHLDLQDSLFAHARLSVVHDSLLDLAADGVLQDDPPGARGRGADRRRSRLKAFVRIVFPISLPGILTVVIFAFSLCVNEFIYAFTFISTSEQRTVSDGVPNDLIRGDVFFWQSLMAATLIPSDPARAALQRVPRPLHQGLYRRRLPLENRVERRYPWQSPDELERPSSALTRGDLLKRGTAAAFAVSMFGGLPTRPSASTGRCSSRTSSSRAISGS